MYINVYIKDLIYMLKPTFKYNRYIMKYLIDCLFSDLRNKRNS